MDVKYVVKRGDTLWDLAGKHLGDPTQWPRIYEHNNLPQVTAVTGSRIADPDLIFVGQVIQIPKAAGAPLRSQPFPQTGLKPKGIPPIPAPRPKGPGATPGAPPGTRVGAGKGVARPKVRSIPFKYNLPDVPAIVVASVTHIATISLKGSVTIQARDSVDFVTASQKGFEIKVKKETEHALGKLITGTKVGFNPATNEVSFENGLTSHSTVPYAPKTKVAVGASSKTGLPVLKGAIQAPTINGKIGNHVYVAQALAIEIELTPRPPSAKPKPLPSARPLPVPSTGPSTWDYLIGGALIVGAGVLIAATIAEDIVTLGVGVADDAPSFAAAAAMFVGGRSLMQPVPGVEPIPVERLGAPPDKI